MTILFALHCLDECVCVCVFLKEMLFIKTEKESAKMLSMLIFRFWLFLSMSIFSTSLVEEDVICFVITYEKKKKKKTKNLYLHTKWKQRYN